MVELLIAVAGVVAGSLAAAIVAMLAQRRARERWRGCCLGCGYDRTGIDDLPCPECGLAPLTEPNARKAFDMWGTFGEGRGRKRRRALYVAWRGYLGAAFLGVWIILGIVGTETEMSILTIASIPALILTSLVTAIPYGAVPGTVFLSTLVALEAGGGLKVPGRSRRCALMVLIVFLTQLVAFGLAVTWWSGLPLS